MTKIALKDLELNHCYKLSNDAQIKTSTLSASMTQNYFELKAEHHQLTAIVNKSNGEVEATFQTTKGKKIKVVSTHFTTGADTLFEPPAHAAAGQCGGGGKRKRRTSKATRKSRRKTR
jgi:hypothetical protein